MSRRNIAILAFLYCFLTLPAAADEAFASLSYRGETFRPALVEVQGKQVYSLEDSEIKRLVSWSTAQLQWSSTGQTFYVFTPGRETFWGNNSSRVSVNGQDMTAPGLMLVTEQGAFMEPAAFLYAISLRAFESEGSMKLLPVVTAVEAVAQEDRKPDLLVRTSSPTKPALKKGESLVTLDMGEVVWDGGEREFWLDDVVVRAQGGNGPGDPLLLDFSYPKNWTGRLNTASLLNDVRLRAVPDFPVVETAPLVNLTALEGRKHNGNPLLMVGLERPVRFFWNLDAQSRILTLSIPHVNPKSISELSGFDGLEEVVVDCIRTGVYPVLQISGRLPEGQAFEFFEVEDAENTLALSVAPEGQIQASDLVGEATLNGYQVARGTIVIDPGHGGSDPGCINRSLGVKEATVTLQISQQLAQILRAQGWTVVLTRETDRDVTYAGSPDKMELMARSDVANNINADIFISIHCNASYQSHHAGSSIHWYKAEDYQLASSLEHVLGTSIGLGQKGLIRNRFVVLRYAQMPSVLVETAYLTNPYEGAKLSDPQFQKVIAQQLAGGLASYIQGRYAQAGARGTD